ncbi:acyl transferase domain-containing protein [Phthorimaea operculella]|nr:acyl transferase domain-containing protein [Phthorimaea operculella]
MAPSPQENGVHEPPGTRPQIKPGDEVVISGISGVFPKSDNTTQFAENLYNNVDLVSEVDSQFHHPEAPRHLGQISGVNKFDAQFFRVTYHHAQAMEPVSRKLLEQAYTAIYDAGINPLSLKGKKVGVFIGTSFSDTSSVAMYNESNQKKGYVLSGCGKSMFSNRISYFMDAKGPSYSLDCSCASSMVCLEHAYQAMTEGECEAAVVGAGNLCLHPELSLNHRKGGMACLDGKTKCFDANGDGPVRAEAVNCIFLQKAKDAKRIYAEVYFAQTEYGLKADAYFLPHRNANDIEQFLKKFYSEIKLAPQEVEYVEANGSAIAEADENELKAIGNVFAKSAHEPVKVGCVKSNMGNAEAASGVCALTKICLAYHSGKLPKNLHCTQPIEIPEIKDGKIEILQQNKTFNRGFIAVNNFSYNGTNCHALLRGRYKPKDKSKYKTNIPRLVLVSGRNDECVQKVLNYLEKKPIDPEVIGMLHNIYSIETTGHTSRGYTIIDSDENNKTVKLSQNVTHYSGSKRPLWLIFSGLGSQWPGMATELMRIPIFASTIQRCHKTLEPMGIDLIRVLTDPDKTMFDKILHCFIGIAAVQIALADVLKQLGVNPDHIIGHSQGEMACAYWDDAYTAEDAILASYYRGIASFEANSVKGTMAAVGIGYKDIHPLCPPEVDVACHNSNESATLSGPADVMEKFGLELKEKGIFYREVPSANLAFHSRYIRPAGPILLEKLKTFIKVPKPRSEKWISTSVPEDRWHEDIAKYSSAEYLTNNLVSPVYFEEAARHIPENAVVVEVAPHGLLQAIMKRSHPECTHIPLTRRGHDNPLKLIFEAFGKIYQEGFELKMDALYPKIEYPVSTETEMLSHLIDWDHSEDWKPVLSRKMKEINTTYREFKMTIYDDEYKYLIGHIRNGKNVFPESAMLFLVWETLAMSKGVSYKDLSVVYNDVHFLQEVYIEAEEILRLNFMINKGNNYFEITQGQNMISKGFIFDIPKLKLDQLQDLSEATLQNGETDEWIVDTDLNSDDIYQHLHTKGLTYRDEFQSVNSTNFKRTEGFVKWNNNWITLIDSLIQLNIIAKDSEGIAVPKIIKKLAISLDDFKTEKTVEKDKDQCLKAKFYPVYDLTRCAGIEIKNIIWGEKKIQKEEPDVTEVFTFTSYKMDKAVITIETALHISFQLVANNTPDENIIATEIVTDADNTGVLDAIEDIAQYLPALNVKAQTISLSRVNEDICDTNLAIFLHSFQNGKSFDDVLNHLNEGAFLLTSHDFHTDCEYFDVVSSMKVHENNLVLLRKRISKPRTVSYIPIKYDESFEWVSTLEYELQKVNKVTLVSEKQPYCGLIGLVKSLRKEYPNRLSLVVVDDYNAPSFDPNNSLYKEQIQKGLTFNILQKGEWGSYCYLRDETPIYVQNIKLTSDGRELKWTETPPLSSKNLVQVCYAGPSERDSQKANALIGNEEEGYGYDFSGFDIYGDRVMGLVSGGSIASTVQADSHLLWPVPNSWSLEDAATVPLPYAQAFYCLTIKGQLYRGQSIFVNSGDGAFGQAVISIGLSLDCTVFTSTENDEKKQFILKLFPQLQEANVGITQAGEFYNTVMLNTKGRGVDFVLSTASGYERQMMMKLTAPCGIFMDINEHDWRKNQPLGMSFVQAERNYAAVIFNSIFKDDNIKEREIIQRVVAEGIENGVVKPITRLLYTTTNVSKCFRLLTSKAYRGRALLKIKNADISTECLNIVPRMACLPNGTYMVVCDETTLGIEIAHCLIKRGARKLMLHLKSKTASGFMQLKFGCWMKMGTQIKISTKNLCSDKNCAEVLNEANKLGDVHGIFVIQETSASDTKWRQQDFVKKYERTSSVVLKLNVLSRNNCPNLREFVVVSRESQNAVDEYIASLSDRICEERLKIGLPAVSLKIKLLDELQTAIQSDNLQPQNSKTVFRALERSIKQKQYSSITYNLKKQRDSDFKDKVVRCLDIESLDNVESRLTVNDLVSDDSQLDEIKHLIKDYYNVEYDTEKLKKLTINSFKYLANERSKHNDVLNTKLGTFYKFIESDEYEATNEMIPMKTFISKANKPNELDETATHLLLIPGFEGHHNVFKHLCETLKVRAVTFQLGPEDNATESIRDIAFSILKMIQKSFVFKAKFYLFGYSFGVNVALEVANLLEKEGHIGFVFCLDSSPDVLRNQLDAHIGNETDNQLQITLIEHFYHLLSGKTSRELTETISKLNNWSDKVNVYVEKLMNVPGHSHQYVRNALETAYRRIKLAKSYNPDFILESDVILFKGLPDTKTGNLEYDYGLSKYTKKPVKVIDIASDHASAPQDCRIPNIVNQFIDPELLEKYNNMCHTYLM